MTGEFDLWWWSKIRGCRVQKPILCFSEKWNFLRLKTGGKDLIFHKNFSNTHLACLSVNTSSPPYSFKGFGLFALTTPVAILISRRLLMVPPAILVPNTMSLAFFSIPESNRLGLPILLIMVQSSSLKFFSQVLTVVLIKYIWNI